MEAQHAQAQQEIALFAQRYRSNQPIASWIFLGLCWVFWAITLWMGGPKDPMVLYQLGAQTPGLAEPWRLGSYAYLHGSWEHIGMNTFVLYQIAPSIERIIGTQRFLLLYALTAFAGGAASALTLEGLSVGASGALWGLLGCQAALAFAPNRIIPAPIAQQTRSGIMKNLVLNTLISFFPGINAAAHFGGGIAGFLLTALIFAPTWPDGHPNQLPLLLKLATWLITLLFLATGLIGISGEFL